MLEVEASGDDERTVPVLHFEQALLPLDEQAHGIGVSIDLTLAAGDLVLVEPGDEPHERTLADSARGLLEPRQGMVRFLGRAWGELPVDQANALRGRIGQTFRRGGWVPYLPVVDNILLAQLHHTRRLAADLRDEASRLAIHFGLPGLPVGRPGESPTEELDRAGYVRAFLGAPALIVLESPATRLPAELLAPLVNAMRRARDRGAAVLWFVTDPALRDDPTLPATRRLRLAGDAFVPLEMDA